MRQRVLVVLLREEVGDGERVEVVADRSVELTKGHALQKFLGKVFAAFFVVGAFDREHDVGARLLGRRVGAREVLGGLPVRRREVLERRINHVPRCL